MQDGREIAVVFREAQDMHTFRFRNLGVAIGKNVYRSVNPLPANAAEVYSQTAGSTPSQELAVFGESSVAGDLF